MIEAGPMDPAIKRAAAVEPVLTFPARIGIARIDNGILAPIPELEIDAWIKLGERLGPDWGEFVPVSLLIVALATPERTAEDAPSSCTDHRYYRQTQPMDCVRETVNQIRLGAARQHIDVVLIYEVFGTGQNTSNPLSVTKLALVGFFLAPSQNLEADGFAHAVLVDVRNGYTYGFASSVADDAAFALSTSVNDNEVMADVLLEAKTAATIKLTQEVEVMARNLRQELAEVQSRNQSEAGMSPGHDTNEPKEIWPE